MGSLCVKSHSYRFSLFLYCPLVALKYKISVKLDLLTSNFSEIINLSFPYLTKTPIKSAILDLVFLF